MKKKLVIFSLIALIISCVALVQIPSIFAIPTNYSDFEGIVISENDNLHNQLPDNFCYSFRTVDDSMTRAYASSPTSSSPVASFIAEIVTFNKYGNTLKGAYINSTSNPYPNIEIPADYATNRQSFWNYIFSISKYWKIYTSETDYYGSPTLFLKPYDYKEPTFELICNPNRINPGETSTCELKVNYYSKINNLNFKLDTSYYEISNIEVGKDFDNLEINNGTYSLDSKNILDNSEEGKTTTIISFKIKSNQNDIIESNNIKIQELTYSDELSESPAKTLAATVNQSKNNNILDLKNPKTKNNLIIVGILLSVIVISITVSIVRNKKINKID